MPIPFRELAFLPDTDFTKRVRSLAAPGSLSPHEVYFLLGLTCARLDQAAETMQRQKGSLADLSESLMTALATKEDPTA